VQDALEPAKQTAPPLIGVCAVVLLKDAAILPATLRDGWAEQTRDLR
jgi:hypothetical protein